MGSNAKAMGKMIKFVSTGEIESTSIADFGLDCSSADSPDLDPGKAQVSQVLHYYFISWLYVLSSGTVISQCCSKPGVTFTAWNMSIEIEKLYMIAVDSLHNQNC